jgi:hypothetical protein
MKNGMNRIELGSGSSFTKAPSGRKKLGSTGDGVFQAQSTRTAPRQIIRTPASEQQQNNRSHIEWFLNAQKTSAAFAVVMREAEISGKRLFLEIHDLRPVRTIGQGTSMA